MRINKQQRSNQKKRILIIAGSALLIVVGILGYITYHNQTKTAQNTNQKPSSNTPIATNNSNGSSSSAGSSVSTPKSSGTSSTTSTGSAPAAETSTTPTTPVGTFVSNHHPNLGGSPAPNSETSTCRTTPGASCTITFTNGSMTKSLPTQNADANGNTYWSWKLQDIGLAQGAWTISVTAANGSKTTTASDPMALEVNP